MSNRIPVQDLNRFQSVFIDKRSLQDGKDTGSRILKNILKFEVSHVRKNFKMSDFIEYLYYHETFESSTQELIKSLESSDYVYLHSYGKNGKTTFINTFKHQILHQRNITSYLYDFQYRADKNQKNRFLHLVNDFYFEFLNSHSEFEFKKHPFILFFEYINDNHTTENLEEILDYRIKKQLYFLKELAKNIISNHKEFCEQNKEGNYVVISNKFLKTLSTLLIEINNNTDELYTERKYLNELGYDLNNILIAVKIFYSAKFSDTNQIVFCFDNLDDVHTHLPENVTTSYTANVIAFIENLKDGYPGIFSYTEDNAFLEPSFVFIYRTSNYLSTIASIAEKNGSEKSRSKVFESKSSNRVRITSVKDSFEIIKKRLAFYQDLCQAFEIKLCPKFKLINTLVKTFTDLDSKYASNFVPATVLRLWNGNKLSFIEFITDVKLTEIDQNILDSEHCSNRVKSEIFFHYFINKSYQNHDDSTPFSKFLSYSFNSFDNELIDERCSLSRLFFTYIYNRRNLQKEINSIDDVLVKGVSLHRFLEDIRKINFNGKRAYSDEDLKDMFLKLFSFEIDNWGNFFSCCSPSIGDNLNSSNEQYKWVKDLIYSFQNDHLQKKVRFYYNDSAPYFMFKIKRSFEYFSFCIDKKTRTLPAAVAFTVMKDDSFNRPYYLILDRVFERVKKITIITFNFFDNAFENYSINEYCIGLWSYNNRLFFDDLISKLIEYIDMVRQGIMNSSIPIGGSYKSYNEQQKEFAKQTINKDFANNVIKYLNLFFELYEKCIEREQLKGNTVFSQKLIDTSESFKKMKVIAKNISENPSNYTDKISGYARK